MNIEDEMISRALIESVTNRMIESLNKELYKDHDPWNTEWQIAVLAARKYQRGKRRKFFDLWLKELQENRVSPIGDGLATLYGGSQIQVPITYSE